MTTTDRLQTSSREKWERTQTASRQGWDKTSASTREGWEKTKARSKDWFAKTGDPYMSKGLHKVGAETFWPTSLDREADKAARILRSFCIDGFAAKDAGGENGRSDVDVKNMQLYRIPQDVRHLSH